MLPKFLCVGAAKAGSTTIHDVLGQHPRIFLPTAKELHFFDDDSRFNLGERWYESQFAAAPPDAVAGEITPAYMSYEDVPARIHSVLGSDVRLIFTLREPVARAYSEYLHNLRRGYIEGNFEDAVEWEFKAIGKTRWEMRKYSFISRGFYAQQIERFSRLFAFENMHFIVMEHDLARDAAATFDSLSRFLGVEPIEYAMGRRSNARYQPRSMRVQHLLFGDNSVRRLARKVVRSGIVRRRLRSKLMTLNTGSELPPELDVKLARSLQERYFLDEISGVEEILGRDLSAWRYGG